MSSFLKKQNLEVFIKLTSAGVYINLQCMAGTENLMWTWKKNWATLWCSPLPDNATDNEWQDHALNTQINLIKSITCKKSSDKN